MIILSSDNGLKSLERSMIFVSISSPAAEATFLELASVYVKTIFVLVAEVVVFGGKPYDFYYL